MKLQSWSKLTDPGEDAAWPRTLLAHPTAHAQSASGYPIHVGNSQRTDAGTETLWCVARSHLCSSLYSGFVYPSQCIAGLRMGCGHQTGQSKAEKLPCTPLILRFPNACLSTCANHPAWEASIHNSLPLDSLSAPSSTSIAWSALLLPTRDIEAACTAAALSSQTWWSHQRWLQRCGDSPRGTSNASLWHHRACSSCSLCRNNGASTLPHKRPKSRTRQATHSCSKLPSAITLHVTQLTGTPNTSFSFLTLTRDSGLEPNNMRVHVGLFNFRNRILNCGRTKSNLGAACRGPLDDHSMSGPMRSCSASVVFLSFWVVFSVVFLCNQLQDKPSSTVVLIRASAAKHGARST